MYAYQDSCIYLIHAGTGPSLEEMGIISPDPPPPQDSPPPKYWGAKSWKSKKIVTTPPFFKKVRIRHL